MIYNNPFPNENITYTCTNCGGTYIPGNLRCLVIHYGKGCCHYGDKQVENNISSKDHLDKGGNE